MGNWKIVVPEETTNLALNPSMEGATAYYSALSGATVTLVATQQFRGAKSVRVQTAAAGAGIGFTTTVLTNNDHYVTMMVKGTLPAAYYWTYNAGGVTRVPTLLAQLTPTWALYGCLFPAAECSGNSVLRIRQNGAGAGDWYIDCLQVEQKGYWTTYCDGNQPGCEWVGIPDGSISRRSAMSRAGGKVCDLKDDYGFAVSGVVGSGMPPKSLDISELAQLPGGVLNAIRDQTATMVLTGSITAVKGSTIHARRAILIGLLNDTSYPVVNGAAQPVLLWYSGSAIWKQVEVHYESGLEAAWDTVASVHKAIEKTAISFRVPDPYWYEIGERSAEVPTHKTLERYNIIRRNKATGQWDACGNNAALGTPFNPLGIQVSPYTGRVYVYGQFINFNGVAGNDYLVYFDPVAETWNPVGTPAQINGSVFAIGFSADGYLWAAGAFTALGGVGGDRLAKYNESTNTWSIVVAGITSSSVNVIVPAADGRVWIGGGFTAYGGIANADYLCYWNGTTIVALANRPNATVYSMAIDESLQVAYVGGNFTTVGGATARRMAILDLAALTWTPIGTADSTTTFNAAPVGIIIGPDRYIYVNGTFTGAGVGGNISRVARWNGTFWEQMVANPNNDTTQSELAKSGQIWVGGLVTAVGTVPVPRMARWTGTAWLPVDREHVDAITVATGYVMGMAMGPADPANPKVQTVYIRSGNGAVTGPYNDQVAGVVTVSNYGTAPAWPRFKVSKTVTGVASRLVSIRNETTGAWLSFAYEMADGEYLIINVNPKSLTIWSSKYGLVPWAVLPGSDLTNFYLRPGANIISCWVRHPTADDVTCATGYIIWRTRYTGFDGELEAVGGGGVVS